MFSLFVRRDGLIDPPALGETDHHCHILPGIDDGPPDQEGSVHMARLLEGVGVKRVVATPHVISDVYPNASERIMEAVHETNRLLETREIDITLIPGAEYYAEQELLDRIARGDLLTFGEEKMVLFEAPVEQPPMIFEEIVFAMKTSGYTPLLAHAERYRFLQEDKGYAAELKRLGVKFQVNHPSFMLPKTSRRGNMVRWLYVKGMVDLLGTDMHRATPLALPAPKRKSFFQRLGIA